jgi:C1A family cysteine protease
MTAEEFTSKYLNTPEEFQKQMNAKPESSVRFLEFFDDHADDEDVKSAKTEKDRAEINWTDKLVGVRNQQTCGSCWIFSALTVLEAHTAIQNTDWQKSWFSPQQMLDCLPYKNPCSGGNAVDVLMYAAKVAPSYERHDIGVVTESVYGPYLNAKTANGCKDKTGEITNAVHYKTNSFKYLKSMTSSDIGTWYDYLSKGPVVAAIAVCPYVNPKFRLYKSGIMTFNLANCALGPNHSIAIYGWGKADVNGVESEIMYGRNSWGTSWGENGDFRVAYQPEISGSCWLNSALWAPTY